MQTKAYDCVIMLSAIPSVEQTYSLAYVLNQPPQLHTMQDLVEAQRLMEELATPLRQLSMEIAYYKGCADESHQFFAADSLNKSSFPHRPGAYVSPSEDSMSAASSSTNSNTAQYRHSTGGSAALVPSVGAGVKGRKKSDRTTGASGSRSKGTTTDTATAALRTRTALPLRR